MKSLVIAVAAFAAMPMAASAQETVAATPPAASTPAALAPVSAPTGKIIIFRPSSIMGYALACPIRWHEREIVELGRGKYAEWQVPAGQYILTNKTSSAQVIVAAGETQYVRCQIKPGFMTGRADLQLVDRETFEQHQADYARKDVVAFAP